MYRESSHSQPDCSVGDRLSAVHNRITARSVSIVGAVLGRPARHVYICSDRVRAGAINTERYRRIDVRCFKTNKSFLASRVRLPAEADSI